MSQMFQHWRSYLVSVHLHLANYLAVLARRGYDCAPHSHMHVVRGMKTRNRGADVPATYVFCKNMYHFYLCTMQKLETTIAGQDIRQFVKDGYNPYTGTHHTEDGTIKS